MTTSLLLSPEEMDRSEVKIEGDRYRHLFRARRQKVGDRMRVMDGGGRARWARVTRIDRQAMPARRMRMHYGIISMRR